MSTLALWAEAAPLDQPDVMVLMSGLQAYGQRVPERALPDAAGGKHIEPLTHQRKDKSVDPCETKRDALRQIAEDLRAKMHEAVDAHHWLAAVSTELHGLALILSSRSPHQARLAQVREELARYEYAQEARQLLSQPDFGGDAAEACVSRIRANMLHFEHSDASDAKDYLKKYSDCLRSLVASLEEKLAVDDPHFYRHSRLLSLATHGLSEFDRVRDKVLRLLYEKTRELSESQQLELVQRVFPL